MVLLAEWRFPHDTKQIMILSECKKFFVKYKKFSEFRLLQLISFKKVTELTKNRISF